MRRRDDQGLQSAVGLEPAQCFSHVVRPRILVRIVRIALRRRLNLQMDGVDFTGKRGGQDFEFRIVRSFRQSGDEELVDPPYLVTPADKFENSLLQRSWSDDVVEIL